MNNNTSFLSSIESGTTLLKLLFYYVIIALGIFFALAGIIMLVPCTRSQTLLFNLTSCLILLFGLFFIYRGWRGQKAIKPIRTQIQHNNWIVVKAYPISFWNYIRYTFFNPKDMGLPMGIAIFYICLFTLFLLDEQNEDIFSVGFILVFILFFLWKVIQFFLHWKSWKKIWNNGPLQIIVNNGGVSYIKDGMGEGGKVVVCDWKEIRRIDFFNSYVKLSTHWQSHFIFYNHSDIEDKGVLLRQVIAQHFLQHDGI